MRSWHLHIRVEAFEANASPLKGAGLDAATATLLVVAADLAEGGRIGSRLTVCSCLVTLVYGERGHAATL